MVRRMMHTITKSELIYILDLATEMMAAGGSCDSFYEELKETITIVDSILDNVQVEID